MSKIADRIERETQHKNVKNHNTLTKKHRVPKYVVNSEGDVCYNYGKTTKRYY